MKKGISPLIAAVILILFVIVIAGLISSFLGGLARETKAEVSSKGKTAMECSFSDITIDKNSISLGSTIRVAVENSGKKDVTGLKIVAYSESGGFTFDASPSSLKVGEKRVISAANIGGNLTKISVITDCPGVKDEVDIIIPRWFILFYDDFEDGSLGADWTCTGDCSVSTQCAINDSYSAYHNANPGSVTSKSFYFIGAVDVKVSYWVRKGSDSCSEDPDSGEDFYVEYKDDDGFWNTLDIFSGASMAPGEIQGKEHDLPSDALHDDFQIRFRQTSGSGGNYDYWHFDNVQIKNKS